MFDLDKLGKLRDAAIMIYVIMSRDQMIYGGNACLPHRLLNALGITSLKTGPTRVYQQRFSCGCDDKRCRATFNIYVIDVQCAARRFCLLHREDAYCAEEKNK